MYDAKVLFFLFINILLFFLFRCEAFSTYPRTYDLIHANGIFTLYKDRYGGLKTTKSFS
jgi:hypothetical protein